MKLSHLILGSLIAFVSFFANHAMAGDDLPMELEKIKGTKIITISDLDRWERSLVDRILLRSDLNSGARTDFETISVVRNGQVEFRERKDVKSLSKPMLIYLASTRICDINVFGECVIYDRRSNDDLHVLVIGSQMHQDGTVEFLQSTFNTRIGQGTSASIYSLAERLKHAVDSRKVIFTRATSHF